MRKTNCRCWAAGWVLAVMAGLAGAPVRASEGDMKALAADLGVQIRAAERSRVTVVDFVDLDKKPTKLGKYLANQLAIALAADKSKLTVVDQSELGKLFDQIQKLSEGLIDEATGQTLGKVSGTEVIVTGTVLPSSLTVRLEVKAIDLQTANVLTGKSVKVARVGIVEKLASDSEEGEEDEVAAAEEDPPVKAKKAKAAEEDLPVTSKRDLGMLFELEECAIQGGDLVCSLMVTNEQKNRIMEIGLASRVWDESGAEYPSRLATIANSSSEERCVQKELLKGVPTQVELAFPDFDPDSPLVQQLRIYWEVTDDRSCWSTSRAVNFLKIPLVESAPVTAKGLKGQKGGATAPGKGGLLNRLGNRVLGMVEGAVMERVEDETSKLLGTEDEEEEEEAKPKKKKKPAGQV